MANIPSNKRRRKIVPINSQTKMAPDTNDNVSKNISKQFTKYICSCCETAFKSKLSLIRHISKCHQIKEEISVPEDANDSNTNEYKETKNIIMSPRKRLQCEKCPKTFVFEKSFLKHVSNEHAEGLKSVKCHLCNVKCPNKTILKLHIENKHDSKGYECMYCSKKFARKAHVTRHLSQKGCDGRNLTVFTCSICPASFTRKDNLMVHLRIQHLTSKKNFLCKHCNYYTKNFSKLILHDQNMHLPKPLKFECDHCGKITSSKATMTKHLEIHGEKKFACIVCGYRTFTVEVMRRHAFTHIDEKPNKCHICNRSYIQRGQLMQHLKKHEGFHCIRCNKRTHSKAALLVHEHLHDNSGELVCPFDECEENGEFEDEKSLEKHVKQHMTSSQYSCDVCGKRFQSEMNMQRHVLTHTLDRPRRCMYCVHARAYVRGEHLLRHVRKHHGDVFKQRLLHVRRVLGSQATTDRVTKSELQAILNVLDAESDRIIEDFGTGVLYAGLQEGSANDDSDEVPVKVEASPLMTETELAENLKLLLGKLIETELLEEFGWPEVPIDEILEKVIENCGARPADSKWARVQRLRENAKHLFLYVIEDTNIGRMLDTHTIDQVIKHILNNVSDD